MKEENRITSLDALKGLCAIMVVFFHVPLPGKLGEVIILFAKSAVPIFFIVSGYFIGINSEPKKVRQQLIKISKLTFLVFFMYFAFNILLNHRDVLGFCRRCLNVENLTRWLIFNEPYFGGHLWYLFAYIYVLFVLYLIIKHKWVKVLPIVMILGTVLYYIFGKYSLILFDREFDYIYVRNFLIYGLPCVSIGLWISNKDKDIACLSNKFLAIMICCSTVFLLLEKQILTYCEMDTVSNNYLGNLPLAIVIVLFCVKNKNMASDTYIYTLGKRSSLYIYIIHPMINSIYITLFSKAGISEIYPSVRGIIVVITSIIVSEIYWNVKKIIRYKVVKG